MVCVYVCVVFVFILRECGLCVYVWCVCVCGVLCVWVCVWCVVCEVSVYVCGPVCV